MEIGGCVFSEARRRTAGDDDGSAAAAATIASADERTEVSCGVDAIAETTAGATTAAGVPAVVAAVGPDVAAAAYSDAGEGAPAGAIP